MRVVVCRCVLVRFFVELRVHDHFVLEGRQLVRLVAPGGISVLSFSINLAVRVIAAGMVGISKVVHVLALRGNLPVLAPGTPLDLVGGRVRVDDFHHLHQKEWYLGIPRGALEVELGRSQHTGLGVLRRKQADCSRSDCLLEALWIFQGVGLSSQFFSHQMAVVVEGGVLALALLVELGMGVVDERSLAKQELHT